MLLTRLIVVDAPLTEPPKGALHGSSPLDDVCCVGTNVSVGSDASGVGDGNGVSVGSGVGLAVSVGGNGVLVGIAACVSATIVFAAEIAVCCISSPLIVVGSAADCPPHALIIMIMIVLIEIIEKRFIFFPSFENN